MPQRRVQQILAEFREELERVEPEDEAQRELLRRAVRDVESLLARSDELPGEEQQPLFAQLREAARQFEKSHPTLTSTAGRLFDALANLGI